VEKRVNLENPDWEPPCNRRDERYMEEDPDVPAVPGVKKSRFLRKERKPELAYKENKEAAASAPEAPVRRRRKPLQELPEVAGPPRVQQEKVVEKNRHGVTVVHFPHDPDDLDPIPRPPVKNVPEVCPPVFPSTLLHHPPFHSSTTAGPTPRTRTRGTWRRTPRACTSSTSSSMTRL
jgi:hypothetical protein